MAITIQLKRGSQTNWQNADPPIVLADGEAGYERVEFDDNGYLKAGGLKIGDGKTAWNDLPYLTKFIITYPSKDLFPKAGREYFVDREYLYRAQDTNEIYYYDYKARNYDKIILDSDIDVVRNNITSILELIEELQKEDAIFFDALKDLSNKDNELSDQIKTLSDKDNEIDIQVELLKLENHYTKKQISQLTSQMEEQKPSIIIVDILPEIGEADAIYKKSDTQTLWHWRTDTESWEAVNYNSSLLTEVEELKADLAESLENIKDIDEKIDGVNVSISNFEGEMNEISVNINSKIDEVNTKIQEQNELIDSKIEEQNSSIQQLINQQNESINTKIEEQNETINSKIEEQNTTISNKIDEQNVSIEQQLNDQNSNIQSQLEQQNLTFQASLENMQKYVDDSANEVKEEFNTLKDNVLNTTEGIYTTDTVMSFPLVGEDRKLYKALDTQKIYYWDSNTSTYELLKAEAIDIPIVKGGIEVIPETETLPSKGESDMLYKTLSDEKVWTWNESTNEYVEIGAGGSSSVAGGSIIVYGTLADFPEVGEVFNLYRALDTQLLYIYNPTTKIYDLLGQGNGTGTEEGYNISLQRKNDYLFAVTKNDAAELKFIYTSIDSEGIPDGPGLATLYINDVRKASYAITQGKEETLDISKLLALGVNSIILKIENSEGEEKAKELRWQITLVDLTISTSVAPMTTQSTEVLIPIQIQGTGTKTIRYYLDGEEINHETVTVDNVPYRFPVQPAGPHIIEIQAECEVNNITIYSNIITLGMMFTDDHMVNTQILSTFNQKKVKQGEIIEIPYLVYNPLLETSQIVQSIYYENGELFAEPKVLYKSRTPDSWIIQNYPSGKITFEMIAYSANTEQNYRIAFEVEVEPVEFDLETIRDNSLIFEFSAEGRSNAEENPNQWSYYSPITDETYTGNFERFAWASSDGWITSSYGETALRLLPKNKFIIPFYPFKEDKLSTGFTLEMELETRDVANQDTTVLSCFSDGIGFQVGAQQVFFNTSLSETSMYFKEDERVRITIIVEPMTSGSRIVYMFINGIICSTIQYDSEDHTKQTVPVPITIGSDECGLDLYKIRFYVRNFNFREQIENYICDRPTVAERIALKQKNDIYDISRNITIGSLPPEIPYLVLQSDSLPQSKDDSEKKKGRKMYFVDKLNPKRSFSAEGVDISVQGTSSAGYPIKNFKVKFKKGIVYNDGKTADGYPIVNEDDLVSECLCLKADYASSEQANNVVLVDYYDELVRDYFLTPPQKENPKVRTGISGRPIVVFWENTNTGEIKFQGQYNMNNDKSNENVFGFDRGKYEKLECWEFCNNTSNLCLFKDSDYEKTYIDKDTGEEKLSWKSDFEARYPDLKEPYSDYTQLKRLTDWIVSTRQDQATGELITDPETGENITKTYNGVSYDRDTAEYRLAKFKNEFDNYLVKEPVIFYYIFTEVFLMIDSRAKNMFLTTFDGQHWFPIPYDFDTAIGINNEGKLVFDYNLEDNDKIGNNEGKLVGVYNGQESALWINVRDAFKQEIRTMYAELRANGRDEDNNIPGKFSFEVINERMNAHQQKCWPENIWNEDAKLKYVDVFLNTGKNYLEMCQGNKKTQREWWLFNTFKYRDSKYRAGDAVKGSKYEADLRIYRPGSITVTPYQHLWPRIDYTRSEAYMAIEKCKKNVPVLLENKMDYANDTETYIASSDRISSFGDLSHLMAGTVDFSAASKLQNIILGSHEEGYENVNLSSLTLGNNRLLNYLNVENCTALKNGIDASQCFNLETVDAMGSNLTSITLPEGGHLKNLNLPETIINITIKNQHMIDNFNIKKVYNADTGKNEYANLTTIVIDDVPNLPIEDLLLNSPKLNCVRIVNTSWNVSSEQALKDIYDKITQEFFIGKDANDKLTPDAILTGEVHINEISDDFLEDLNDRFPELVVYEQGKAKFFIRYLNYDRKLLYKQAVVMGGNAIDPIVAGVLEIPIQPGTEDTRFEYSHWSSLPTNVTGPQNIIAQYDTYYRVQFLDGDDQILNTQWIIKDNDAIDPLELGIGMPVKTSTAQYDYIFTNWDINFTKVNSPLTVKAVFNEQLRRYNVYFYNGSELLETHNVFYGNYPEYSGDDDSLKRIINGEESEYFVFKGWSPGLSDPVIGETIYRATFERVGEIEDSWAQIIANVQSGNLDNYGYAGIKKDTITYNYKGETITDTIEFEIIDKNHDLLSVSGDSYNKGAPTAGLTFKGTLSKTINMNTRFITTGLSGLEGQGTLNNGGWLYSELRAWLNGSEMINTGEKDDFTGVGLIDALPVALKNGIKPVKKYSDGGYYTKDDINETIDKIFIPSLAELNITNEKLTYNLSEQGTPYILYTDDDSRRIPGLSYWTRSSSTVSSHAWNLINSPEDMSNKISEYKNGSGRSGIVFMFCI